MVQVLDSDTGTYADMQNVRLYTPKRDTRDNSLFTLCYYEDTNEIGISCGYTSLIPIAGYGIYYSSWFIGNTSHAIGVKLELFTKTSVVDESLCNLMTCGNNFIYLECANRHILLPNIYKKVDNLFKYYAHGVIYDKIGLYLIECEIVADNNTIGIGDPCTITVSYTRLT